MTVFMSFAFVTGMCMLMRAMITLVLVLVAGLFSMLVLVAMPVSVIVHVRMAVIMRMPQSGMLVGMYMAMLVHMVVNMFVFVGALHLFSPFKAVHGPSRPLL
jgi:hypothetical protein